MPTIYVSHPVHADVLSDARSFATVHVGYGDKAAKFEEIKDEVDAVLLRGERFGAPRLSSSPQLKIVARHGVGVDNVDIDAATRAGIWVTRTPGANSQAVAEHVFALLLSLGRRVPHGVARLSRGDWGGSKAHMHGIELGGRTLGLVGFGSIARQVASIGHGFGMPVQIHDPFIAPKEVERAGYAPVDMEALLRDSDVLSLHAPLTDDTRDLIDAAALATMKRGAILINTARAGLVDELALVAAIKEGHLAGAGLDVVTGEEKDPDHPLEHSNLPLDLPNLVITPHVGGQTEEAFRQAGEQALQCIRQALAGEVPAHAVNSVRVPTTI